MFDLRYVGDNSGTSAFFDESVCKHDKDRKQLASYCFLNLHWTGTGKWTCLFLYAICKYIA